MSASEIM